MLVQLFDQCGGDSHEKYMQLSVVSSIFRVLLDSYRDNSCRARVLPKEL